MSQFVLRHVKGIMRVIIVLGLCLPLALTGCSLTPTAALTPESGLAIQGVAHGGQQPITNGRVYLYAAGVSGYGTAAKSLLASSANTTADSNGNYYVTTDANGYFNITGDYTCTPGSVAYLYEVGGSSGAAVNSAIGLLAVLGACPAAENFSVSIPYVFMDEVSTIAAAYAMAGYATDATHVAAVVSLGQTGIQNAFANAANLASLSTGLALTTTPGGNGTVPQATINTLANILASCVNTTSPVSTGCSTLFSNARSGGATGNIATDTATAAIYLAHHPNPGASQMTALFGLGTGISPFAPALIAQPNNFMLPINFTAGGLSSTSAAIAIDGSGNVWVANSGSNSVTELNSVGVPVSGSPFAGGGLSIPTAIAIDSSGNAWITNTSSNSITELTTTGLPVSGSPFRGNGLSNPNAIAMDGAGNAWITNSGSNSVSKFTSAGVAAPGSPFTAVGLNAPTSIATDGQNNAWITNASGTIAKLANSGSPVPRSPFVVGLSSPTEIVVDHSGNILTTGTNGVTQITSSGIAVSGTPFTGGGLTRPTALAIDGSDNTWIINGGSAVAEITRAGVAVPGSPYEGLGLSMVSAIAIDGSGNVWVVNGNNIATELIGAAKPIVTPLGIAAGSPVITPPAAGAYFGAVTNALDDPGGILIGGVNNREVQAETLESQIGRKLELHTTYKSWNNSDGTASFPDMPNNGVAGVMLDDVNEGRVPVVSWVCGDADANVAAGADDTILDVQAAAVMAFPGRIMLRWFWEFDYDGGKKGIPSINGGNGCLESTPTSQDSTATKQANFIAAWQHIYNRFKADGVTNVTWLWNPGSDPLGNPDGSPNYTTGYYPGSDFVDWIGHDEYGDVTTKPFAGVTEAAPTGLTFDEVETDFYNVFNTYGKPLMIGETGGCQPVQAAYINSAATDLPIKFPKFRAFIYFDSMGTASKCNLPDNTPAWSFTPEGLSAFGAMGALPYFSPII